ncbi:MAG: ABC transporter ATP-binding protein [Planctomycetes bacterium]|nr:ABC transporter ATP-binding protein [Planctomycetota bacterium]
MIAKDLVKHYDDGQVQALNDINLRVKKGEYLAILGPSGSGKSTLMHIISTLDRPTSGEVLINGQNTSQIKNLHFLRAKTIGFIFQLHNLIPSLTLVDNVMIPLAPLRIPLKEKKEQAQAALEAVGLEHRMHHVPTKVSGGERQRTAFARALVNDPDIILGDEPTGNVDTKTGAKLLNLLLKIKEERKTTLVIVTHNPEIAFPADHEIIIRDGIISSEKFKQ